MANIQRYKILSVKHWLRRCAFILITGVLIFFCHQFWSWDLLSAQYYQQHAGCSEEIYNFATNHSPFIGDPVFGDKNLYTQCREEELIWKEYFKNSGLRTDKVQGKCNKNLKTELLSFKVDKQDQNNANVLVPNIVHYTSLGKWEFTFLNYLSFKSVHFHIKPSFIYIHGDGLPYGPWFDRMKREVANVYYVSRARPIRIQGRKVMWLEHSSDVVRLQTLLDNGGIYLDTDIIVLRSFDPLRQYSLTLGRETKYGLGSGIIVAQPHSTFLCMWRQSYRSYNPFPWHWASYAVWTPNKLAHEIPEEIHIEEENLQKPSWTETEWLYDNLYQWYGHENSSELIDGHGNRVTTRVRGRYRDALSGNYAMHIWKRYGNIPSNPEHIKRLNSTLGEVMRFIYFGSRELVLDSGQVDTSGEFGRRWHFATFVDLMGSKILDLFDFNFSE